MDLKVANLIEYEILLYKVFFPYTLTNLHTHTQTHPLTLTLTLTLQLS